MHLYEQDVSGNFQSKRKTQFEKTYRVLRNNVLHPTAEDKVL